MTLRRAWRAPSVPRMPRAPSWSQQQNCLSPLLFLPNCMGGKGTKGKGREGVSDPSSSKMRDRPCKQRARRRGRLSSFPPPHHGGCSHTNGQSCVALYGYVCPFRVDPPSMYINRATLKLSSLSHFDRNCTCTRRRCRL